MASSEMMGMSRRLVGRTGGLALAAIGVPLAAALFYWLGVGGGATVDGDTTSPGFKSPITASTADRTPTATQPASAGARRGNPLWVMPLSSLPAARERPVFAPSRRPPPVFQLASAPPSSPVVAGPRRPALALVGIIVGGADGVAIFRDETTKAAVRLRTGEGHAGWTLRSIKGREATFEKGRDVATINLLHHVAK
jgi:general secretion pathway protein N